MIIRFCHAVRALALAFVGLSLAACTLGRAPPPERLCTLIGCGPSMEIALVGEHVPTEFSVQLTTPSADLLNVSCTDGTAQFDPPDATRWSPACPAGGVTLQDFTPTSVSLTVRWSEGEVTQHFQPVYSSARPNGPGCEPTCQTTRLEVRIPAVPAYGDVSTWELYTDAEHGFSLRYPAAFTLDFGTQVDGYGTVYIGDKLQLRTSPADPLVCQGECPMLESTEPVTIAGREGRLVRGYIGSIGGNIPQHFMLYLVRSGSTYISLILFAAGRHATSSDSSIILSLQAADIELLNRMVQTLEFAP